MSRQAQGTASPHSRHSRAVGLVLLTAALGGCAGGIDLDRFGTDRSLTTGSIAQQDRAPDGRLSDEAAIRSTVAAWMPGEVPPETVPWVNSNTGSTGAITRIADSTGNGTLCRTFRASRESFDGVGLYDGKACSEHAGPWSVMTLQRR